MDSPRMERRRHIEEHFNSSTDNKLNRKEKLVNLFCIFFLYGWNIFFF